MSNKKKVSGVEELKELSLSYSFKKIEERVEKGEQAIWGGGSWEAPLIYAAGVIPINIAELWRDESEEAESVGENEFQIPPEFCSMIKVIIGRLKLRESRNINKILYFGGTCEPISSVMDLTKKEGYETYCIENVTAFKAEDKRDEVIKFLANELNKVSIWLTGNDTNEDLLKLEIKKRNLVLKKVNYILELHKKNPLFLSSISVLQILNGSNHYWGNYDKYLKILDLIIEEFENSPIIEKSYIPLVVVGGIAGGPGILNVIEESNGVVVGWMVTGKGYYREDLPPLESIAHFLLDAQANGEHGEAAGTSATLRRHRVEELVNETNSKGIIATTITGCPYGSIVQKIERDHFKKLGIPIVQLESTVHKGRPTEEQVMRVRTFVEML